MKQNSLGSCIWFFLVWRDITAIPYRISTGPEQGFPCVVFPHREKPVFSSWDPCNVYLVFPTGKILFITGMGLQCILFTFHRRAWKKTCEIAMYFQMRIQKDFCSIMAYVRYYVFFNRFRNSLASFTLLTSTYLGSNTLTILTSLTRIHHACNDMYYVL